MDVIIVAIVAIACAVVLALSLRNYAASRLMLKGMNQKVSSINEELLELQRAVEEFDDWAASYLPAEVSPERRKHAVSAASGPDSHKCISYARIPAEVYARQLREWAILSNNFAVVKFLDASDPCDALPAAKWAWFVEKDVPGGAAKWDSFIGVLSSELWSFQRKGFAVPARTSSGSRGLPGPSTERSENLASL